MQIKRHFLLLLVTLMLTLLSVSCSAPKTKPSVLPLPIEDIHHALWNGIANDRALANKGRYNQPPAAVSAALLSGNAAKAPLPQPQYQRHFNVSVRNAPAQTFFMGLVEGTPYNIVVDPDVKGNITLDLKNVTVEDTLRAVRDTYGYQYHKTNFGYEVFPREMKTRIFTINYIDVQRSGKSRTLLSTGEISERFISSAGGGGGGDTGGAGAVAGTGTGPEPTGIPASASGSSVETREQFDFWEGLETSLKSMVGTTDGRSVVVNPQAGIVVVHAYPDELQQVGYYINRLQNNVQRQVVIEAKILDVTLKDSFQAGIDWNLLGLSQTGNLFISPPLEGMLNLYAHDGSSFSTLIHLLEQQGNVQVLSSPHVSTMNNQNAVIKVGDDEFFVTSVTSNVTPTNGTSTTSSSVGLTPFFAGITLDVTPQIDRNGEIILHIRPSISTVENDEKVIDLGNGQVLKLPLALSTIRETDNVVRAKDGQVIVIGGLMRNEAEEKISASPWLSKIPFAGIAFRSTEQKSLKGELVILLKPVVVNDRSSSWVRQLQQKENMFQRYDRRFHFGSRVNIFGDQAEADYP